MYTEIFLDTETTGNTEKDYLCQLAFKTATETFCELYKPPIPIPPEASAVTHITNKSVADKPTFTSSKEYQRVKEFLEKEQSVVVAHNAQFDIGMLVKENIIPPQNICTLRLARYLDTENKIPQYKLQYLRYYLNLDVEAQAHDALGDVLVLEKLYARLKEGIMKKEGLEGDRVIERMIEISSRPSLMYQFNFGKHVGKTVRDVAEIDPSYLDWLLNQKLQNETADEDWIYTLKYYLKKQ